MPNATVIHGDAQHLPLADCSVDAVVCDPPYELGFMSKKWDSTGVAYDVATWREALRVLKPGGFLLAFGGTRTWHRLACAIEDAGFEIRDNIMSAGAAWVYGSGFPKSLDVSKAIDRAAGAEREPGEPGRYTSRRPRATVAAVNAYQDGVGNASSALVTTPATDDARRWQGWGTSLKPSFEPVVVARKPLAAGTVAANVLQWGCGALNVDGCRVAHGDDLSRYERSSTSGFKAGGVYGDGEARLLASNHRAGRWPTNVVLSHVGLTDGDGDIIGDACADGCVDGCPVAELDAQSGVTKDGVAVRRRSGGNTFGGERPKPAMTDMTYGGGGTASRFFPVFRYQAKAPARERPKVNGVAHPTVKPLGLMRWLVRLVGGQPGSTILDPFSGSGTTLEAALLEGFNAVGVERSAEYLPLIQHRIDRATPTTAPVDDVAELTLFDVA